MPRELTREEQDAVRWLQIGAKYWPKTLTLLMTGSSKLVVIRTLEGDEEPVDAEHLAVIDIPVENSA